MSLAWKKLINKRLRDAGVKAFDVAAVNRLSEHIEAEGGTDESLDAFTRAWSRDGDRGDRLTLENVEAVLAQLHGSLQQLEQFAVIDAFDIPKIAYDPVGRKLYEDPTPRTIFAPAQAKQQLYLDRLMLVSQRLRRGSKFQPQGLAGGKGTTGPQLTDVQSLKGAVGVRRFVVGCISRSEDGRYILEDSSGTVPLDLSQAQSEAGFYTENCIVVATGEMRVDGAFQASALEFPATESRSSLPMAAQRLNFFGGPPLSAEDLTSLTAQESDHMDDRLVVLSNVHLDSRDVLNALTTMFTGYSDMQQVPALFVFMGNFHSRAAATSRNLSAAAGADVEYAAMRDGFSALGALVDQFPRIRAESHFVFVPGPDDTTCSNALPQTPLPAFFTAELQKMLPNAKFTTNPCRIRYLTKEIVLFRYDILSRLRRRCLMPPKDPSPDPAASLAASTQPTPDAQSTQPAQRSMWKHLALTLLQQSHLCPLPLLQQPILWQYDHALHLYPLPHAVIVADGSPQASYTHDGCVVFNPGSFSDGMFMSYKPCTQVVESNEIPKDGQLPEYEEYEGDGVDQGSQEQQGEAEEGHEGGLSKGVGAESPVAEMRDVDNNGDDQDAAGFSGDQRQGAGRGRGMEDEEEQDAGVQVDEEERGDVEMVGRPPDSSDDDNELVDDGLDADLPSKKRVHTERRVDDQGAWDAMLADE